jgi:hypothetical protein
MGFLFIQNIYCEAQNLVVFATHVLAQLGRIVVVIHSHHRYAVAANPPAILRFPIPPQ